MDPRLLHSCSVHIGRRLQKNTRETCITEGFAERKAIADAIQSGIGYRSGGEDVITGVEPGDNNPADNVCAAAFQPA